MVAQVRELELVELDVDRPRLVHPRFEELRQTLLTIPERLLQSMAWKILGGLPGRCGYQIDDVLQELRMEVIGCGFYDFDDDRFVLPQYLYRKMLDLRRKYENKIKLHRERQMTEEEAARIEDRPQIPEPADEHYLRQLPAALESLQPCHRQAITLQYFGGLSVADIAEQLKVPVTTVNNWLYRGKGQLRQWLQACDNKANCDDRDIS